MKTSRMYRDKDKVFKVLNSCLTSDHIKVARKMIENYCKMYNVSFSHSGLCGLFIVKSTNVLGNPVISK